VGGEKRRQKSLRIGVHHADVVVWEPVYRTHLMLTTMRMKKIPARVRRVAAVAAAAAAHVAAPLLRDRRPRDRPRARRFWYTIRTVARRRHEFVGRSVER
jgi:hypothetical protein